MKQLLRFLSDYTSLGVLLVLCLVYSYVTFDEQHPTNAAAGAALGKRVEAQAPNSAVVVFIRDTGGDREFADALEASFQSVQLIERVSGTPRDINAALRRLGEAGAKVDYVVTHYPGSTAGPLQPKMLGDTKMKFASLAELKVETPPSYYWPSFLTRANLVNVVNRNADVAIIAIGMTLVIISGGIDLSVGSVLAVSAVMTAFVLQSMGGADASLGVMALASLGGVLAAGMLGGFTGATTTYFNVPSFVVTLSMMMVARGAAYMLAGSPDGITIQSETFSSMANGEWIGIPNPIWVMLALYAIAWVVMSRTTIGRYVYAVGGNAEAARLSGVPVSMIRIMVFAVCGALSGLCGVMHASRFETGLPLAGQLYELQVIAAVVVGGASLSGGSGTIVGTLIGAMILAVIENGLNMAHVGTYEKMVVFGVLILAAVLLDKIKVRRA